LTVARRRAIFKTSVLNDRLQKRGDYLDKDTSLKLIEAATPLFAKKGYAAVSVREVSQAASANVAAVSYHFGGKEGLYHAVLEYQFEPIAQALERIKTMPAPPPAERLALYASFVAGVHRQRPYLLRFMHGELTNPTSGFDAVIKKYIPQVFRFLHQALADGVAAGEFRPGLDAGFATISLAGILNFYFIAKPIAREVLPLSGLADEQYTAQAFDIFLKGIRREEHE
jgi:TetR/AcrR family transcriptional regulator